MKKIIITERQASLLNKVKVITEAEESGVKSIGTAIGEKVIRVVISGEDIIKFKDRIIALITRQDPEARVGYFEATGKIVGNVKEIRLDSMERDLKAINPTISIKEKPMVKSLKEINKNDKLNEKEHRVQQHDFTTNPTTQGAVGLKIVPIRITGENVGKLHEVIIKEIRYRDPNSTVAYFIKTGKIVGNIHLNILTALEIYLKNLDKTIKIEQIHKKNLQPQIKITQEQYDRLFSKKTNESNKVKGGLDRVDKTFKKEFTDKNVQNLGEDKFNIKKPNSSVPKLDKKIGHRMPNMNENTNQFNLAVYELIRFLYGKVDYLSPFWEENGVSYNMLINTLFKKGIILKKDDSYVLSKSIGSTHITPEIAVKSVKNVLTPLLQSNEQEVAEVDNPAEQNPQFTTPTISKNKLYQTIAMNPEIAILKSIKGGFYVFTYSDIDKKNFEEYAKRERKYIGKDDEGDPDFDYSENWYIDEDIINNYVNDNINKIPTGDGLDAFEKGTIMTRIDDALKNELMLLYDKDKIIVSALSSIGKDPDVDVSEMTSSASSGAFTAPLNDSEKDETSGMEEELKPEDIKANLEKQLAPSTNPAKRTPEAIKSALKKKREEELNRRKETGEMDEMTGAASSGAFTGPMQSSETPVVKRNIVPEEKPIDEMTTSASSGQYTANAFPNIDRNGKFKNESKTPAQVQTQYPKGEFVKMGKCTKYDNGKGAENGGCSQGAVDNVVTFKKSKNSVISPSLDENAIFEEISKKTGKSIDEIKTIINSKNIKTK